MTGDDRRSTVDLPFDPQVGLCVRSGFFALNAVAEYFTSSSRLIRH